MQPKEIHSEVESGVTNSTTDCSENFAEAAENDSLQTAVIAKSVGRTKPHVMISVQKCRSIVKKMVLVSV
jgi:hypothetical protein